VIFKGGTSLSKGWTLIQRFSEDNYTLSNLRIMVNGQAVLGLSPSTVTIQVIDQILITSVETTAMTLDQIQAAGIVLDDNSYLGFQFTIGLATSSNMVSFTFPVIFDNQGVPVPQPISPPAIPSQGIGDVPVPTIVPVLLNLTDQNGVQIPNQVPLPNGTTAPVKIPGILVIPGDVGYLKQFFTAKLMVSNGAPGGSGLSVSDVAGTIKLPPGADGVLGTADDPLSLPALSTGPQSINHPVYAAGPDGKFTVNLLNPGDMGEADYYIRGDQEGFYPINFDIKGTLDGLAIGPVSITGSATGGVLVRNPYFDMTFAVPAIVRAQEQFKVYVTVKNTSQSLANALKVTIDAAQLSGAFLVGDASQQIDTLLPGASKTLTFTFQSQKTGQVTASYLHLTTQNGTTGELTFTLGVDERGVRYRPIH
jgi:hypothetical protein